MASIFLSYARADASIAERIAKALEAAGHSVWWDRELHAGERFSVEIDRELKSADLVAVLWSQASIDSPWVQDEAATGRDTGRLVPVLLAPIEPPLGFRQYHAVDLSSRRGRNQFQPLIDAIALKSKSSPKAPATSRTSFRPWTWIAAAAAIALATAGVLWFWQSRTAGTEHTVVVAANGGDMARSTELARSIALDLGRYRTGSLGSLSIVSATDSKTPRADYRVDVGVSGGGNNWHTDLSLGGRGSEGFLWTSSFERADSQFVDVRQQATSKIARVLDCVGEVQASKTRLSRETLGLYLDGCAKLADYNADEPGEELLSTFRQLTQKAPNFAQGWAWLALLEARSYPSTPPQQWHDLTLSAREHVRRAKQANPYLPTIIAAEAYLPENYIPPGPGLAIVELGLSRFPDSVLLHSARANFLARVGRLGEGVKEAKAALDLDPLSPTQHDTYASALAYSGRTRQAFDSLEKAENVWPGSTTLNETRYRLDLRYGDPKNALVMLERRGGGDARPVPMDDAWRLFLRARTEPNQANIDTALGAFRKRAKNAAGDWGYFQALGTFGRVDEAFRAMQPVEALEGLGGSPDTFFRVHMRSIYSDPRFIGVAQRLGMLDYWKKSDIWPDFCRDPKLPYDCREEAAKYAALRS